MQPCDTAAPDAAVIYAFKCESGHQHSRKLRMAHDLLKQPCPACGEVAKRVFNAVAHRVTFRAGFHTGLDENFESERAYRTHLDAHDLVEGDADPRDRGNSAVIDGEVGPQLV